MIQEVFADYKEKFKNFVAMKQSLPEEAGCLCPKCRNQLSAAHLARTQYVCGYCGHHFPMPPMERIALLNDSRVFREFQPDLKTADPLCFPEYQKKLAAAREKAKMREAVVTGLIRIREFPVCIGVMNPDFLMGSMGTVVGEKITALAEYAARVHLPLVIYSASGGARMQEGLFSLMQMAKTAAAIERYRQRGGLFVSCLTNPTTGGVSASFASLGDIIIAEPEALICFAGPRVIEQTIGRTLPEGFQRAEFLQSHGFVDIICARRRQKELLYRILKLHPMRTEAAGRTQFAAKGHGKQGWKGERPDGQKTADDEAADAI